MVDKDRVMDQLRRESIIPRVGMGILVGWFLQDRTRVTLGLRTRTVHRRGRGRGRGQAGVPMAEDMHTDWGNKR